MEVAIVGLAAGFLAALLRTWEGKIINILIPPGLLRFGRWIYFSTWWADMKQRKPLGCATCMGGWCTFFVCGMGYLFGTPMEHVHPMAAFAGVLASAGIAAWLNYHIVPPAVGGVHALDDLVATPLPATIQPPPCTHPYHQKQFDPNDTEPCPSCKLLFPRIANFTFMREAQELPKTCADAWHQDESKWDWRDSGKDWGDPTGTTRMETATCPTCGISVSRPQARTKN